MFEKLKIAWYSRNLHKIPPSFDRYLNKYNGYYLGLNPQLKKRFRERTYIAKKFIRFLPVQRMHVTEEMKVLITSALVQMTFGLNRYILRRFNTIYVVPNTYKFAQYEALLGHVDYKHNVIVMSWPSVKEGFVIPDDAINVALHEIAHALHQENKDRILFAKFFEMCSMKNWNEAGIRKLYKIRAKKHRYLRDYGGANIKELFAVCIETFFEQALLFKENLPELYHIMSDLLNQDPTKEDNPIVPN